ncbi:EEF1A lysine methyltransferase 3 isoform X1 [Trifolium pratense]|uniref:EEF1A lysine methyltransferase 3 isoform X1 n=1 Tax=Trifolium pratense TaxID=57577 RepID=UPI001E690EC0|nr:EEF1A lysine methyltransferase 3 isoform X1 [Trifolium pratense]
MEIAIFSPSSLFFEEDDDDNDNHIHTSVEENAETQETYVERKHQFPGMELIIREFSFHQLNANLLWPGTFAFAEWLVQHRSCIEGRRIIELGSGTGALAIFLRKSYNLDITTSDYDDQEIMENIAHNCSANDLPVIPHIKHTWGDKFPNSDPDWDLIIASDILLYVKQYPNLIQTISFLLKSYKHSDKTKVSPIRNDETHGDVVLPWPAFLMSWRRRIGKEDESIFFGGCEKVGLEVKHIGSRVYCISLIGNEKSN